MRFVLPLALSLFSGAANATIYNVNIFGELPDGVTAGPVRWAYNPICSATQCAGGGPSIIAHTFVAQPGDVINFGTLSLYSSVFGDSRQMSNVPYYDANGQYVPYALGTWIRVYPGRMAVSYEDTNYLSLDGGYTYSCHTGNPACSASSSSPQAIDLTFTLPTGFIELAWTYASYTAPTNVGAVPEPASWVLMIAGFAGIGLMAYRRRLPLEVKALMHRRAPLIKSDA
jgi:hypothetical protein